MAFRYTPLFVGAVVLTGLCCCPPQAAAQFPQAQVQVQMAGNAPMALGGPDAAFATSLDEMQSLMELRIDALQRAAGLTDSQTDKLRLAAIAAAKSVFQNSEKFGGKFKLDMQTGAAAPEEAPSLSDEDAESKKESNHQEGFQDLPPFVPLSAVLEQEVWRKAEASILSDEQQQKVAEYWKERKLAQRRSAVEKKISELDEMLYFTADQRTQMTEIVDRVLGDELEQEGSIAGIAIPNPAAKKLTADDVQQVLSPVQLERFKNADENPLAALGPLAAAVQQALGQQALGQQALGQAAPPTTPLVPAADTEPADWHYTFDQPKGDDWQKPDFDDSQWKVGKSGFGSPDVPNSVVGVVWRTPDIWLRRTFDMPKAEARPHLYLHHDENVQVYINGVLAVERTGFGVAYNVAEISDEALATLKPTGNVLAIHCHQTLGGQYIDAGIVTIDEKKGDEKEHQE